tara:strand:+ start:481 stop:648 length:168 start_codon:yes stop_codon:yes gene_type:complete
MQEVVTRGSIGVSGFFATLGLQQVHLAISIMVGLATLTFMVLSVIKVSRELKNDD